MAGAGSFPLHSWARLPRVSASGLKSAIGGEVWSTCVSVGDGGAVNGQGVRKFLILPHRVESFPAQGLPIIPLLPCTRDAKQTQGLLAKRGSLFLQQPRKLSCLIGIISGSQFPWRVYAH